MGTAFQNDFAARMDWTIKDPAQANHNPEVVVRNGQRGRAPVGVEATVGTAVALDAGGSRDPDNHTLKYSWFFYPEAGTGIPGQPVSAGGLAPVGGGVTPGEGGIPSAPEGGPRDCAAGDDSGRDQPPSGGDAARRRHCAHHPGCRRQRHAAIDLVPARDHDDQGEVIVNECRAAPRA